jgi:hypothetical protein
MNLIEQFPDVSMEIRNKIKMRQKNYGKEIFVKPVRRRSENALTDFHHKEFRKLHLTVFMIIAVLIGGSYLILLNSPWLFIWVSS